MIILHSDANSHIPQCQQTFELIWSASNTMLWSTPHTSHERQECNYLESLLL